VVRFKLSVIVAHVQKPPPLKLWPAGTQWNPAFDSEKRARRRQFDAFDPKVVFAEQRIMFCVANLSVP
jgi:hypothetical protein